MQRLNRLATLLFGALCNRRAYVWLIRAIQLFLCVASIVTAFQLRFEFSVPPGMRSALWWAIGGCVCCRTLVFHLCGLDRGVWRYFAAPDLVRVARANVVASALASAAILTLCPPPFPRSVLILDFLVSLLLSTGVRAGTRLLLEAASYAGRGERRRAFIYGGGAGGVLLLREARSNPAFGRSIDGFIDDDPNKLGMLINGLPVRGAGSEIPELAAAHGVSEVLIAIPSASGAEMQRMVESCRRAGVAFRTMPAISEMFAGRPGAAHIREVAVEDILGRSVVELDRRQIGAKLRGRVALVTGAAGSIGSQLCRQIARFQPAALVAFDISETALFHLDREIRRNFQEISFHPELGSIQNPQRLREVFRQYSPAVVYHAAAYKHVPIMESHVFEAVENNVFGTYNVAVAAAESGAGDFVMISSDKAVRPSSMMGVTKRVAELVIGSFQNGGPRYVSVRFGNVLGSNGSVVPIFNEQIAEGGPVTVTSPDMQRYFMTIPEAAQLVLQASTMGNGGEIFVLDMGRPVRIVDLARQLILLSGLIPGKDIQIQFTGPRPGEKLCEELSLSDEQILPTQHERIRVFAGACSPPEHVAHHLGVLRTACADRDLRALLQELRTIVPDYAVSRELLQGVLEPGIFRLAQAVNSYESGLPGTTVPSRSSAERHSEIRVAAGG